MGMLHYMPEIIWHDRDALLSVDFLQQNGFNSMVYKLVTCSLRSEVRIWKMDFRMLPIGMEDLGVYFIANLVGHRRTVNIARFSPDGEFLVSGDCEGCLIVWKIDPNTPSEAVQRDYDLPSNVENWIRYKTPLSHDSDICSLCWNPDSHRFAVVSNDESVAVYEAYSGRRLWHVRSFRRFPNGVTWDPRGSYVVTMSTDRKLDILCAERGTRLRSIQNVSMPKWTFGDVNVQAGIYKLFHDDQLMSFSRIPEFSPDGELLFVPSGLLETGSSNIFGTYIFRRRDFQKGRPVAFIPSTKASFRVCTCPVVYKLRKSSDINALKLPYRIVWAVLMSDSVTLFDSQLCRCIGYISDLQYDTLTAMAWSVDGRVLMISSMEGYISFIRFSKNALGDEYGEEIPLPLPSRDLEHKRLQKHEKRRRKLSEDLLTHASAKQNKQKMSPVNSLLKYFKKIDPHQKLTSVNTGEQSEDDGTQKRLELLGISGDITDDHTASSTGKPIAAEKRPIRSTIAMESNFETEKKPGKKRAKITTLSLGMLN